MGNSHIAKVTKGSFIFSMDFLFESSFLHETTSLSTIFVLAIHVLPMKKESTINNSSVCQFRIRAIKDTMAILSGKWKILIIGTLLEGNSLGFMDLIREVDGIGSKMLSKELQDLEMNQLVSRTVMDTKPITVKYALTEYGETLKPLIDEFANWGADYRNKLIHSQ